MVDRLPFKKPAQAGLVCVAPGFNLGNWGIGRLMRAIMGDQGLEP